MLSVTLVPCLELRRHRHRFSHNLYLWSRFPGSLGSCRIQGGDVSTGMEYMDQWIIWQPIMRLRISFWIILVRTMILNDGFYSTCNQHVSHMSLLGAFRCSNCTFYLGHPWSMTQIHAQFGHGWKTITSRMIHQNCPEFQPPWTVCICIPWHPRLIDQGVSPKTCGPLALKAKPCYESKRIRFSSSTVGFLTKHISARRLHRGQATGWGYDITELI